MKQVKVFMLILILYPISILANQKGISSELQDVKKWFSAWEFVSKKTYNINTLHPVELVFFDEKNVYSTSKITIPKGEIIDGPNLLNKKFIWKKAAHNGKITLPDSQVVPIGLMSFAAPIEGNNQTAFFVMPLTRFWKEAKVESKELGLENLVTGVFLHEFSHSQQMQNFGKKMSGFEKDFKSEVEFSDDIIQNLFKNDAAYSQNFLKEVELFYQAVIAPSKTNSKVLTIQAMNQLKIRQQTYFTDEKEKLKELDDFFLTMEGFGQFTMYTWLIHPKGANLSKEMALAGVRRGRKWWSQEQGLALFLILDELSKPSNWAKIMVGKETKSVIEIINEKVS